MSEPGAADDDPFQRIGHDVADILRAASRAAESSQTRAEAEAAETLAASRTEAAEIVAEAQALREQARRDADEIVHEARARADRLIGRLQSHESDARAHIEAAVSELTQLVTELEAYSTEAYTAERDAAGTPAGRRPRSHRSSRRPARPGRAHRVRRELDGGARRGSRRRHPGGGHPRPTWHPRSSWHRRRERSAGRGRRGDLPDRTRRPHGRGRRRGAGRGRCGPGLEHRRRRRTRRAGDPIRRGPGGVGVPRRRPPTPTASRAARRRLMPDAGCRHARSRPMARH